MIDRNRWTPCLRPSWLAGEAAAVAGSIALVMNGFDWVLPALVAATAAGAPLAAIAAIIYLRTQELVARAGYRISYTCPGCARTGRPHYKCHACGGSHDDLRPGVHGVFFARCGHANCGAMLPTCHAAGRDRLRKACRCGTEIPHDAAGSRPEFQVAIVGAASSGKSNLLVTAVWCLREQFAPENGLKVTFADPAEEARFNQLVGHMKAGVPMNKTFDRMPALTIGLESEGHDGACLLHLFDAAGEHFADERTLGEHPIERADAIIFVIDPFAEDAVNRGAIGELDPAAVARANAATEQAQHIAARLINVLEKKLVAANRRFHIPVAVVVTKVDVGGLAERYRVGGTRLDRRFRDFAEAGRRAEREESRVRRLLSDCGLSNLVSTFDAKFDSVGYFAASPLGRSLADAPGRVFEPRGVLSPIVWLCWAADALGDADPADVFVFNAHLYAVRCLRGVEGPGKRAGAWLALAGAAALLVGLGAVLPFPLRVLLGIIVVPLVLCYCWMAYCLVYR